MKIYELIYYWDDCAYGCDINSTKLVKTQQEVEKLKQEFHKEQSKEAILETDTPDNVISYQYEEDRSALIIKEHNI